MHEIWKLIVKIRGIPHWNKNKNGSINMKKKLWKFAISVSHRPVHRIGERNIVFHYLGKQNACKQS